jgi:phosphoglycolate phosphatase-like HAD superfamily hydrolase
MVTGARHGIGPLLKGVVFDWDGTLADIDDREIYCINGALAAHNIKPVNQSFYIENYYQRPFQVGSGPRMVLEAAVNQDQEKLDEVYETYRKLFTESPDRAKLQRGALDLLQSLRERRLKVGIATMRFTRDVVAFELQSLGVEPYAEVLLTREDLGFGRRLRSLEETVGQRVQLVTKVLYKLGIEPEDSPLVGDSWWDVRAGKELGMRTVLVRTGFSAHNDFSDEKPTLTVNSLVELRSSFQNGEL